LIHWRRRLGWQEKLKEKLWQQGSLPLTTIKMEVLLPLAFLKPTRLKEKIAKGICCSYDRKYTKVHKCVEKKLFYIDCEEEEEKEQEISKEEDIHQEQTLEKEEMNPIISCKGTTITIVSFYGAQ